ncbi:sensor histidine kinase [Azotosporobacter soli]|uniref:sensor histidine kinase n=1 Tax=Azotosporobacter soli TaxID=3055040 RepID=UPI0031FE6747
MYLNFSKMTIRRRFALSVLSVVVLLMSLLGLLRIKLAYVAADHDLKAKIITTSKLAALSFSDPLWNYHQAGLDIASEALFTDDEIASLLLTAANEDELYQKQRSGQAYQPDNLIIIHQDIYRNDKYLGTLSIGFTNFFRLAALQREIVNTLVSILVIATIIGLLISYISNRLTRPIYRLSEGTDELAKGNLMQRLVIDSDDEIGRLGQKFNAMAETLYNMLQELASKNKILEEEITNRQQAETELRRAHDQLETKVQLRTQELTAANQELRAMNDELIQTVSLLQKTQRQLVESEKMASLGNLVAGVAHEINTPVGVGITAASHLVDIVNDFRARIAAGNLTHTELRHFVDANDETGQMILTNLERAASLIRSFKQVSVDQGSEQQRVFDLKHYLEDIIQSLHAPLKKTKHTVRIDCPDHLLIDGFPGSIAQIVTNLLMNSLVHAYEPDAAGQIRLTLQRQDAMLLFSYCDDGRGMSPDVLEKIFDPFFTTRRGAGSTGLGLHILYNIVTQKLHGSVECESKPNEGTCFLIRFPIAAPRPE